jgi:CTP:phosphocholine cytidylyltransferase-like protein
MDKKELEIFQIKKDIKYLKEKRKENIAIVERLKKRYNYLTRKERCNLDECMCPSLNPNDSDMD